MGVSGGQTLFMFLIFLLIAALPYASFFFRFKKNLNEGAVLFEDYAQYARKIFTIFAVVLFILNILGASGELLMLFSFAPVKALISLSIIALQYVVFVFLGVVIVKAVFKFLKINSKEDLTTKKIWTAIFVSAAISVVIFIVLSFAITALLINFR